MSALGRPAVLALLALVAAVLLWPDFDLLAQIPAGDGVFAAVVGLLWIALASSGSGPAPRLLALGVATVALAFAYDAVRGERGRIVAAPGTATRSFEEMGRVGRRVGLHPLGFDLAVADVAAETVRLAAAGRELTVTSRRAATVGRYRIGLAGRTTTSDVALLLGLAHPDGRETGLRLQPGATARDGDLEITLETYFPDFALDDRQQPFTRSEAPNNPAALLRVRRGETAWRVFVLRAAPGIHRPEGLDRVLRLADVEVGEAVELRVSREPAAPVAAAGLLVAAVALLVGVGRRPA